MTKKINPNLSAEQKLILFEEGTERSGSSELNHEKREGSFHCANCGEKLFDSKKNMRVDQAGLLFMSLYQMYLKQKQITILVMQELNIIAKNVVDIMDTYSMTDQNQLEKDFVIMEFA